MGKSALVLLALFAGVATSVRVKSQENPIRKIVRLMQDMSAEIESEKKKEQELFEKFMCICNEYPAELTASIASAGQAIAGYTSKIEEETALKSKLAEELKTHAVDKDTAEKDLGKATTLREKESAEFDSSVADLEGSIGQLSSAIPALERGASASALLQNAGSDHLKNVVEASNVITDFDKKQVMAFLDAGNSEGADAMDASPGSGEVLGILKQMKDDMAKNLEDAKNSDKIASAGFADLKAAKDEEIALSAESIESKEKKTGELAVSVAQSQDALEDATEDQSDSQKMLNTLVNTCDSKKLEWQARLKSRTDEIAAISEAVNILNDDDALDVFKKAVPAALVEEPASGFLQTVHSHSEGTMMKFQKALDIIRQANKAHHDVKMSFLLSKMTTKLYAKQGPDFGAVSKMIDEMVTVLTNEQTEDSKKKDWCNGELAKAEKELAAKQEKMDTNTATISQVEDEIAGLKDDVKALETSITNMDKAVFEATEARKQAHAEYSESLQLTEAAVGLIGKAKNRLAKFYNPTVYKAAPKKEATMEEKIIASYGFIQRHQSSKRQMPDMPELPEKKQSNSGGVVALMDTIVLDLQKDSATAGADEKNAQKEYVSLMTESQVTREADKKSLVNKKTAAAEREAVLVTAKQEKQVTFEELNNAHTFLGDLHSSCDFVVQNFEMREQARATELESLKSAKAVLAGASL